ncbi:Lrp/AsnC family transcriptional regulator [Mumia zhuanghuii]|uniref:Lrp/AsnC family transcriptional regulator n=2 Tax=Mumia TaxID=1546255 RepID=A0ABW1QHS2_9ACTN|nr:MULTISPECIES: Lrp/AsnC family transcriptional regulator [Mumia]KAA1418198.1 Lrp/AsnC family transcriptional regulator [Mumia zhuanghuii]
MAGAPIDDVDRRILRELERDGRMSMRRLAETVHISRANAYARVERLRDTGVITGFAALVDPGLRGLGTSAYVALQLQQEEWHDIRPALAALEGIEHVALLGGEFDALVLVRAEDNAALRQLILEQIQMIPGVLTTRTFLVFEELYPERERSAAPPEP